MKGICPNINHPDWKYAVENLGKSTTLIMYDWFSGRIPSEKEVNAMLRGATLSQYNNQRVWGVEGPEGLISSWHTVDGNREPVRKRFRGKAVEDKLLELRKKYYKDKIGFSKGNMNTEGTTIIAFDKTIVPTEDLKELHLVREVQRSDLEEEQVAMNEETLSTPYNTGEINTFDNSLEADFSRPLENMPVEPESLTNAKKDIETMRKAMPLVEQVIFDETMGTIARVEPGGKIIRVNPKLIQKDTIGHEFGHIMIDLLGGMTNSFIRKGREQLRGSDIEEAVMKAYPDLVARNDERIDKEILATAIGMERVKLAKEEALPLWQRWLLRFFRKLRSMFGMDMSVARQLAQRLVEGKPLKSKEEASIEERKFGLYEQALPAWYKQESRRLDNVDKTLTILNEMIEKEQEFRTSSIKTLQKKLDVLAKKGTNTQDYKDLETLLQRVQRSNPTKSLVQMIRFAVNTTKELNKKYQWYMNELRKAPNDKAKRGLLNAKLLTEWKNSVSAFNMLDDLHTLYADVKNQIKEFGVESDKIGLKRLFEENREIIATTMSDKEYADLIKKVNNGKINLLDILLPMLEEAITVKDIIQKLYVEQGNELITDFLAPYSNHVVIQYKNKFEREWLAKSDEDRAKITREKYIQDKLKEVMPTIEKETRDLLSIELGKASSDVSYLERLVGTILDSRDVVSSSIAKVMWDTQEKIRIDSLEWKYRFIEATDKLAKQIGRPLGMADEKYFDFMLETDPTKNNRYTQHLVSNIPSRLYQDYADFRTMLYSDTYRIEATGEKPTMDQKHKIDREWIEKNAPRNKEAFHAAQLEFAEKLYADKAITKEELARWKKQFKVSRAARTENNKIFHNPEAVEAFQKFYRQNKWEYRELADYYKKLNAKWDVLEAMRKAGLRDGKQTDARVEFYDLVMEARDRAAEILPTKYGLMTRLPSMMKNLGQRMRSTEVTGQSKVDVLKQDINRRLQRNPQDTEFGVQEDKVPEAANERSVFVNEAGETVYFLPIYYVNEISLDDQSFDLPSLYYNYMKMAVDFGHKQSILAEMEMAVELVKEREVMRRDENGKLYVDSSAKKALPADATESDKAIADKHVSNIADQLIDFVKTNMYGMQYDEEPDWTIPGLGYKINRAKVIDGLSGFTAINLLGMNFIAGLANINLGEITQIGEAIAGQYTSLKSLSKATGFYYKHLGGILGDVAADMPSNIVNLLNERYDTLNEFDEDGNVIHGSKFKELMRTNTVFFTSHAGEHYMQTRFMLSMLIDMRAYDAEGNDIGNMLEMYEKGEEEYVAKLNAEGRYGEYTKRLRLSEKVANFGLQEQLDFSAKLHRILSSMHGEYSKIGQSALQRQALGRMALAFRKFIVPGVKRRFQKLGPNNLLAEDTEGYYRTFGRFAKLFMKDLVAFKFEAMKAHGRGMTKLEAANMKRIMSDVAFLLSTIVISMLVMRAKTNDDDDNDILLNNLAYQAMRLRSEMMFYINPLATLQILRSPMASMSLIENTIKLAGQLLYPLYSGTFEFQVYQNGSWKDHLKIEKTITGIIPVFPKQYFRILDAGDLLSWFQQ